MDEAAKVLDRLKRIHDLDRDEAKPAVLLDELRHLVVEAEEWARAEGDARARSAVAELGGELRRFEEVRPAERVRLQSA
jgi:hypothetical protein